ncbi:MAG: hypothetical protein KME07_09260 [Pegethrix bostrychoides GSE-TBD4-15B]|jgi:hypothetical protein|uniref:Uncharacterized protein n=1 Tax=Pegethrix bostrychoides GSE-TBD4-15B TaxID=2839662 RepID=A0A951U4D5_9CYAN|nr:hypothetical protein [Pegethrix bostrychoides GSE-TBD4-15B]
MCIVFKEERAFAPQPYLTVAQRRLQLRQYDMSLDLITLSGNFRLISYCNTEHYQFVLGVGSKEPAHLDLPRYQAIAILQPNSWVVKGETQIYPITYQQPGDLIILDTGLKHEVVWDKNEKKPTEPWLYLFIDPYDIKKWQKSTVSLARAEEMATEALTELQNLALLKWLMA